jgi:hypothetical protein
LDKLNRDEDIRKGVKFLRPKRKEEGAGRGGGLIFKINDLLLTSVNLSKVVSYFL